MAQKKPDTKSPEKTTQAIEKPKGVFDLESLSNEEAIKVISRYINPKATEAECMQFLHICKINEFDPFVQPREIHLIKYSQSDPAQIVVGYQKYIQRGEASGKLKGWKTWTEGKYRGEDFKACIKIWRADWTEPFYHEVYFDEYKQTTASQALNKFWQKSRSQIIKVVISQGFRLCFSTDMRNMPYTVEEMPASGVIEEQNIIEAEIVEEPTPQPKPEEPPKEEKKKEEPKPKKEEKPAKQEPEVEPTNGQEPEEEDLGGEGEEPEEEEEELTLTAEDQQPIDMATEDQKKDILDKMKLLVDEYGRDEEDLKKKMAGHLKKAYGTVIQPKEIPGRCDYKEAKNLIVSLNMTIDSMKGEKL